MKRVLFLVSIILLITGCMNSTTQVNSSKINDETSSCSMGEVEMNGRCCRYISRYPNKDGSCPVGYDDSAPSGYIQNMCWKEKCN